MRQDSFDSGSQVEHMVIALTAQGDFLSCRRWKMPHATWCVTILKKPDARRGDFHAYLKSAISSTDLFI